MIKLSPKHIIGISIIVLIITGIFTLTSNLIWLFSGPPSSHIVLDGEGMTENDNIYTMNISYLVSGYFPTGINFQDRWDSSNFYYPNSATLIKYSIVSQKLPALVPSTNLLYINASFWFMTYIFVLHNELYNLAAEVNQSIILNSTHLSQKGSLVWTPSNVANPFSIFTENDFNYSLTFELFETFYVENMTSKTFQNGYAALGLIGANAPIIPNPTGNGTIVYYANPYSGSIFTYKNWSVIINIGIFASGVFLTCILLTIAFYINKKMSNKTIIKKE